MGDGDVTHYTAKSSIDDIEAAFGMTALERKIERVLYFFYEEITKQMITDVI